MTDSYTQELINPPLTYPSRLVKPVDVMHHRLKRESAKGGILEGLKILQSPLIRVEGSDELPNVCMVDYSDNEIAWAGAKTNSKRSSNQVENEAVASFLLSFNRDNGNYSIPLNQKPWGLLNWVERFKDTLEIGDDGQVDATLEFSCMKPLYCQVRESEVMDLSWSVLIDVEFCPFPIQRGTRRFGWKITTNESEDSKDILKIPS